MTSVEVNVEKFKEAFAKFQQTSKRSVATNLRQQGKLIVTDIAKRTPPGDFQATGWKRIAGERPNVTCVASGISSSSYARWSSRPRTSIY